MRLTTQANPRSQNIKSVIHGIEALGTTIKWFGRGSEGGGGGVFQIVNFFFYITYSKCSQKYTFFPSGKT